MTPNATARGQHLSNHIEDFPVTLAEMLFLSKAAAEAGGTLQRMPAQRKRSSGPICRGWRGSAIV